MKDFRRSIAGKTLLILALMLCIAITAASAVGILFLLDEGMYRTTEKEMIEDLVPESIRDIAASAGTALWEGNEMPALPDGIALRIVDRDAEKTLYESAGFAAADGSADIAEYRYCMFCKDGSCTFCHYYYGSAENTRDITVRARRDAIALTDEEAVAFKVLHLLYALRFAIYPIAAAAALLCILLVVMLCCVSGHRPGTDEVFPGPLHIVPFDVLLALTALTVPFAVMLIDSMDLRDFEIVAFLLLTASYAFAAAGLMMSAATRAKLGTLIRGMLVFRVFALLFRFAKWLFAPLFRFMKWLFGALRAVPSVWRTALVIAAFSAAELLLLIGSANMGIMLIFEIMLRIPAYAALLYAAVSMMRLRKGAERLANGDYETKISVNGMTSDFRSHAESLNRAADGMREAVQNELKSERMKTALITNVSHDIKTPLTSVISYADLIGKEESENPKIREYSAVLLRQSEKLKRLVTDLVDASRASSGDMEISLEKCDARLFISQADGEYGERLSAAGLSLITDAPRDKVYIFADSRRMQRVFDNLMNNILKYAQPGTRVYLTLENTNGSAVITFRNTSREMLNIDPAELTERFVRGDNARTGEGSGLGLSIAKDLTVLQGGNLTVFIDGDLFKAELRFPIRNE